ncbi:MAG: DUF2877 domain-containing protein [Chloroflexi bacterium]|nr:DUF2877 domain-containing protein [Chloroflexota bacterium]
MTVLASDQGDLPQGILTDAPGKFSFEGLSIGSRTMCRAGVLHLGDSFCVHLEGARRWEGYLPSIDGDMQQGTAAIAWRCAWDALNVRQAWYGAEIVAEDLLYPPEKKHSALFDHVHLSMRAILAAAEGCRPPAEDAVGALIGLGTGLTPSGDDLLAGYMAGVCCAARGKAERLEYLSTFTNVVMRHAHGTNDISRTYLHHAARGRVSSRLFHLASAICGGAELQHVRACVESAMQVGHTSGMETVTGLLFGLGVWDIL